MFHLGQSALLPLSFLAIVTMAAASVDPLDTWAWRSPRLQGNALLAIAKGNDVYVAVGRHGTVVTSRDGFKWQVRRAEPLQELNDVAFGDGRFVAVGHDYSGIGRRLILVSSNGVDWADVGSAFAPSILTAITFGNGKFVAAGYQSYYPFPSVLLVSLNATNWTDTTGTNVMFPTALSHGNGRFVAVSGGRIHSSTNGIDWELCGTALVERLEFVNGRFVAAGYDDDYNNSGYEAPAFATSVDGVTWTNGTFRPSTTFDTVAVNGVGYMNGRYVATGATDWNGRVWTSTNAVDWELTPATGPAKPLTDLLTESDQLVGVGDGGRIAVSSNGQNWTDIAAPLVARAGGVTHGNGRFVAVGRDGQVQTSTNGVSWSARTVAPGYDWLDVAHGSNRFVAIGLEGRYMTSTNAEDWTMGPSQGFSSVAYGRGQFVGVSGYIYSSYQIKSSLDGVTWTNRADGNGFALYGVTYGNGLFVAVGSSGNIMVSPDATNWTPRVTSADAYFWSVASGNGVFVATGARLAGTLLYPAIYYSSNAITWNSATVETPYPYINLNRVAYGGGVFVAGSSSSLGTVGGGMIFTSVDGRNWQQRKSPMQQNITGIACDGTTFVVTGDSGGTIQSGNLRPRLVFQRCCFEDAGLYELVISSGVSNTTHVTDFSPDLLTWTPRYTNRLSGTDQQVFTGTAFFTNRFYRARLAE